MKGGDKSWDPRVAASYCLFVVEVFRQKEIHREAWSFLCKLVEDEDINELFRHFTLDSMARASGSEIVLPREWGLPNIASLAPGKQGTKRDFFRLCLEMFFDPSKYNLMSTDRSSAVRILVFLWENGTATFRHHIFQRLSEYLEDGAPGDTHLLDSLRDLPFEAQHSVIQTTFVELRQEWANLGLGSIESDRRRIELILGTLLNEEDDAAFDQLLRLLRQQPERPGKDHHDFEIWMTLGRIFTPEMLSVIRERQGDSALYHFLASVLTDSKIDLEFSIFALMALFSEFGIEGLVLDDRIPGGILESRGHAPNKYSVVDVVCQMIESGRRRTDLNAYDINGFVSCIG